MEIATKLELEKYARLRGIRAPKQANAEVYERLFQIAVNEGIRINESEWLYKKLTYTSLYTYCKRKGLHISIYRVREKQFYLVVKR